MSNKRGRPPTYGDTEAAQLIRMIREAGELDSNTLADLMMTTPESVRRWQRGQVNAKGTQLAALRAIASGKKQDWHNVRLLAEFNKAHPEPMAGEEAIEAINAHIERLRK